MAKTSGGTRGAMPGTAEYKGRKSEAEVLRQSGKYSSVEFFDESGGYLAFENSKREHKPEEIEAARYLAMAGYKVILKSEDGNVTTSDGYVFSMTYEQKTPGKQGTTEAKESVRKCLVHAVKKAARVPLIFDQNENYNRQDIEDGISYFENGKKDMDGKWKIKPNPYRFDMILVVDKYGGVYEHYHNKK